MRYIFLRRFLKSDYKNIVFLIISYLLLSLLEVLGLGLILPVIKIILNPDAAAEILRRFQPFIFNVNEQQLKYYLIFSIIVVYIVKNALFLSLNWYQIKMINSLHFKFSNYFYKNYLSINFSEFLKKHSAYFIRFIDNELRRLCNMIGNYCILISEILVTFSIFSFLVYLNPKLSLIAFFFLSLVSFLILKLSKKKLVELGKQRIFYEKNKTKLLQETYKIVRLIKLNQIIDVFSKKLDYLNSNLFSFDALSKFISIMPRIVLEISIVLVFFIFLIINLNLVEGTQIILTLSILALAAFRLLPSTSRIISSYQIIQHSKGTIDLIDKKYLEIKKSQKNLEKSSKELKQFKAMEIKNLIFYFKEKIVLNNISLKINSGEKVGIIGKTGSGKSTLLDLISGFHKPNSGYIKINNNPIHSVQTDWQKKISYISQKPSMIDDSIIKNIIVGSNENKKIQFINELIEICQLKSYVEGLKNGLLTTVGENGVRISGGQAQRIVLARSLYKMPNILLLDEATNALDIHTEKKVFSAIFKKFKNLTLINVSHYKNKGIKYDKVFKISGKKIKRL